jgi:hypothetical protein
MGFSNDIIKQAWKRQGGICASCGKVLVSSNRDKGMQGAWHAHHRKPISSGGTDLKRNCVILCINQPEYCHFKKGHGSRDWGYYARLTDDDLPYLYDGQDNNYPNFF